MSTALMGRRRSAVEIIHEILSLCNDGGLNKTAIMYRSNLSYDQLLKYLGALCEDDQLFKNTNGAFQITTDGIKALKSMANAVKTLRNLKVGRNTS